MGLVGHNPGFGELAAALAGSGAKPDLQRLAAKYPTGAVAVLDFSIDRWAEVEPNSGMLALYLTPAELEPARTDAGGGTGGAFRPPRSPPDAPLSKPAGAA